VLHALLQRPTPAPAADRSPRPAPARREPLHRRAGCACGGGCPACRGARTLPQAAIGRPLLQRKPKSPAPSEPILDEHPPKVGTAATLGESGASGVEVVAGSVEAATPFYPGDVILVAVSRLGAEFPPGTLELTLPPGELELVGAPGGATAWLRVAAPPESIGGGRTLEATLSTPAVADPITLRLHVAPTPERAAIARSDEEVTEELVAVREEIGAVRSGMRALPPEEREAHAATLVALRKERSALRTADTAPAGLSCSSDGRLQMIQEAVDVASARVGRAIARLQGPLESDPDAVAGLARYLRVDPSPAAADARRAAAEKSVDVFNLARNGMLTAAPDQFDCVSDNIGDCASNKAKAASVGQPGPRGRKVTVCARLFGGALPARAGETDQPHLRAFSLFHEFVHLAGISAQATELPVDDDEMYVFDPRWPELSPEQAGTLADAFAALAFGLSQPAGG